MGEFLRVMPPSWRADLQARVVNLDGKKIGDPDARLSKILRTALSHVAIADSPHTSRPVALSQEHAALVALRTANKALHAIGRDFQEIEIVLAKPERPAKRKRAA